MYEYSIKNGLQQVVVDQKKFLRQAYSSDIHKNLAEALGFDILEDGYLLEESCSYDAQDYSVVVKTPSSKDPIGPGRNAIHFALVEVHCYGVETIIFVDDPLSLFELLSDLLAKQNVIRALQEI